MTRIFRFYKDNHDDWYIDIPEWTGSKSELEMVQGADTMLDIVSDYSNECFLKLSDQPFDGAEVLKPEHERNEIHGGGGDYILEFYQSKNLNHKMWLCEVTRDVFSQLPPFIYFSKVTPEERVS